MKKKATALAAPNPDFPATYQRAREALAKCHSIDECKSWKNKAAAVACYARQCDDDSLFKTAMLIKGRAVRRMGELMRELERAKPGPKPRQLGVGGGPQFETRQTVSEAAGLSERQTKQALRIASIPEPEYERAIEAEKAPTLTALARLGTKPAQPKPAPIDHLKGRDPEEFSAAIYMRGEMETMADMCERTSPAVTVRGSSDYDYPEMRVWARTITDWCVRLEKELPK